MYAIFSNFPLIEYDLQFAGAFTLLCFPETHDKALMCFVLTLTVSALGHLVTNCTIDPRLRSDTYESDIL
jgi:hypothetical protein